MEKACPDAWLINFTNPSGIVTEAVLRHTNVKCIGLCNVPINMEREILKTLGADEKRVRCVFAGLNHLSFIGKLYLDGRELLSAKNGLPGMGGNIVQNIAGPQIPAEMIDALGFIPSPYLKYFYLERDMLKEEMDKFKETGKTRADEVMETEELLFQKYGDPTLNEKPEELMKRGGAYYSEAAVSLMNSIWNDSRKVHVVNTANRGAIEGLPGDAVVETNCLIGKDGAVPLVYGALPPAISGLVHQVKAYERLAIEAAVEGDPAKVVLALVNNPLVRDMKTAGAIFGDLLLANKDHLGYFKEAGAK
jgi:6-phospho-beta-glucosidase